MIRYKIYSPSSPKGYDAASAYEQGMHRAVARLERRRTILLSAVFLRKTRMFDSVLNNAIWLSDALHYATYVGVGERKVNE